MGLREGGAFGSCRQGGIIAVLIGLGAFLLYFLTNLIVLYGSRIREYYADLGSVRLGSAPHHMATALYKLAYGSTRLGSKEELKRVDGGVMSRKGYTAFGKVTLAHNVQM